jgi:DNA-binding NtrC family response regulator
VVGSTSLAGRSILVIEDEPLIAIEITTAFERVGATVTKVSTARQALAHLELAEPCAVIMDLLLGSDDARPLITHLEVRGIPYVIYSGFVRSTNLGAAVPQISKPANADMLVTTVAGLLARSQNLPN